MEDQKIYGYLRVSTSRQTLQGNKDAIILTATSLGYNPVGIIWIEETVSGKKHWKERKLNEIVEKIQKGDIFITFEVSRIGRTGLQINEFVTSILQKGASMHFCDSKIKIDDSIGSQALMFALSISAQIERELTTQRVKAAVENRKAKNLPVGRARGPGKLSLDEHKEEIAKLVNDGVKFKTIASKYNVTQNTITTFVKRYNLKPYKPRTKKQVEPEKQQ